MSINFLLVIVTLTSERDSLENESNTNFMHVLHTHALHFGKSRIVLYLILSLSKMPKWF